MNASVIIVMGSDSDLPVMQEAAKVLEDLGVTSDVHTLSAHRSPDAVVNLVETSEKTGTKVFICGAGGAAHLAGTVAAHTALPVIGVPISNKTTAGVDALFSTVQMPPGVPVATMGVGKSGATNAGFLAVRILALSDAKLVRKLADYKNQLEKTIGEKSKKVEEQLQRRS